MTPHVLIPLAGLHGAELRLRAARRRAAPPRQRRTPGYRKDGRRRRAGGALHGALRARLGFTLVEVGLRLLAAPTGASPGRAPLTPTSGTHGT